MTIPSDWKLTFGNVVPFSGKGTYHGEGSGVALRIYEVNKENLRAVMTDVKAVRDASIELIERRTTVQRKMAQKASSKGMRDVVVEARVTEWVNPDAEEDTDDAVPEEFLKIGGPEAEDD